LIDKEIKKIIDQAGDDVQKLLKENINTLHKLSQALLERENLDGEEIELIMKGEELPPFNNKKENHKKSVEDDSKEEKAGE